MSVFARFAPRLQEAIVARLGWTSLRPVQEEAGTALMDGRNAVVLAPTAGGKTEAAVFPTLSQLVSVPAEAVGALYVAPIKALLNNQSERLGLYAEMVGLRRFVWHGDTTDNERKQFLREPAELLMTTPESLEVMLISPRVNVAKLFGDLRVVVIDEIHALAGTDRGAHLMSVLERIAPLSRHDLQRVGLSATVGNPEAILHWLRGSSRRDGTVVKPKQTPVRRHVEIDFEPELEDLAQAAAQVARGKKSLFFCQTRSVTEAMAAHLRRAGTNVFVHHSAVSREERQEAEERFHRGADACIVCTSTLELGIDVGDLDRVLQAEAPDTVGAFLQRMGRTGRREGQVPNMAFFCETREGVLQAIALIELAKSGWVESVDLNDRSCAVLIHQLLALSLAHDGVSAEDAWQQLSRVPDFQGFERDEFDRLTAWLTQEGWMAPAVGRLVLGPKAEKRFGRRNFMDLYAVFASPQSYTVETPAGQPLGSLNQAFVDRLVDGVSCFLLGGKAWAVTRIDHDRRRLVVESAPRGKRPTWGGFLPQFLGREICEKIRDVLISDQRYAYLTATARAVVEAERQAMAPHLSPANGGLQIGDGEFRWWTFAGGRINSTLRYAIPSIDEGWSVTPDNFQVTIRGAGLTLARFHEVLRRLRDPEFWNKDQLWQQAAATVPAYRLSKFQPLMPPWIEREVLARYFWDFAGTRQWISQDRAPQGS